MCIQQLVRDRVHALSSRARFSRWPEGETFGDIWGTRDRGLDLFVARGILVDSPAAKGTNLEGTDIISTPPSSSESPHAIECCAGASLDVSDALTHLRACSTRPPPPPAVRSAVSVAIPSVAMPSDTCLTLLLSLLCPAVVVAAAAAGGVAAGVGAVIFAAPEGVSTCSSSS